MTCALLTLHASHMGAKTVLQFGKGWMLARLYGTQYEGLYVQRVGSLYKER